MMNIPFYPSSHHAVLGPPEGDVTGSGVSAVVSQTAVDDDVSQRQYQAPPPTITGSYASSPTNVKAAAPTMMSIPTSTTSFDAYLKHITQTKLTSLQMQRQRAEEDRHRIETHQFQQRVQQQRQLATLQANQTFAYPVAPVEALPERTLPKKTAQRVRSTLTADLRAVESTRPGRQPKQPSRTISRQPLPLHSNGGVVSQLTLEQDECATHLRRLFAQQMRQQEIAKAQLRRQQQQQAQAEATAQSETGTMASQQTPTRRFSSARQAESLSSPTVQSSPAFRAPFPPAPEAKLEDGSNQQGAANLPSSQRQEEERAVRRSKALFHCYILKYLRDAGLHQTAASLAEESGLSLEATPPYNPPNGVQHGIIFSLFVAWWQRVQAIQAAAAARQQAKTPATCARTSPHLNGHLAAAGGPVAIAVPHDDSQIAIRRESQCRQVDARDVENTNVTTTAPSNDIRRQGQHVQAPPQLCASVNESSPFISPTLPTVPQSTDSGGGDVQGFNASGNILETPVKDEHDKTISSSKQGLAPHHHPTFAMSKDYIGQASQAGSASSVGSAPKHDEATTDPLSIPTTSDSSRSSTNTSNSPHSSRSGRHNSALSRSRAAQQRAMRDMMRVHLEPQEAKTKSANGDAYKALAEDKATDVPILLAQEGAEKTQDGINQLQDTQEVPHYFAISPEEHIAFLKACQGSQAEANEVTAPSKGNHESPSRKRRRSADLSNRSADASDMAMSQSVFKKRGATISQGVGKEQDKSQEPIFAGNDAAYTADTALADQRKPDDMTQSFLGQSLLASQAASSAPQARPLQPHFDFEQTILNIQLTSPSKASAEGTNLSQKADDTEHEMARPSTLETSASLLPWMAPDHGLQADASCSANRQELQSQQRNDAPSGVLDMSIEDVNLWTSLRNGMPQTGEAQGWPPDIHPDPVSNTQSHGHASQIHLPLLSPMSNHGNSTFSWPILGQQADDTSSSDTLAASGFGMPVQLSAPTSLLNSAFTPQAIRPQLGNGGS